MDTSEKRFEYDIERYLITEGGYEQFVGQSENAPEGTTVWLHNRQHDVARCIYLDVLCEFIAKTQPREWARYTKYYGDDAPEKLYQRFEQCVSNQGLISVLRNGIKDMGVTLKLCYFKPESTLNETMNERYAANVLGCTRQFRYSTSSTNTIDMVLSVNGIPIVALELKNQFKGQDVNNAMRQYKEDRNSKEFCFRLDHRFLVYFAVDLYEVWMTTELKDSATRFVPFNQGSNGAGVSGGAGNPANPTGGYDTAYLWERVLRRDSLLDLLHRFISHVKEKEEVTKNGVTKAVTKERMLFPRFHQYDVVHKILDHVKKNGTGHNYLVEHSAGSGKSNSIAWMAYRLASVHDANDNAIFNSVIVVTNRIVLDGQLQDTINSFEHDPALVEAIDERKHSHNLATAINDGKRIIICTIQKFLFAHKEMERFTGRRFAVIVDEAHQGQTGDSAKALRRALIDFGAALKHYAEDEGVDISDVDLASDYVNALLGQGQHENQSFFAFTATPTQDTLEAFGTVVGQSEDGKPIREPFHVYSMRQAIEEGYILDVLANYMTIQEAFRLIKVSEDDPELIEGPAARALFRYYKKHGHTIAQKTEMIMTNFLENGRYQVGGKGKAMVVADSRANAVRYYFAIRDYMARHPEETKGCGVMIAFSGEISLEERPSEKPYTEATLNVDENGKYITTDKAFRKAFRSGLYNILVVAEKYQTGFDEPLLHSMYVDKRLQSISAVQTLSRLNRTAPGKDGAFVLDFANTEEEIKEAFHPFYETTTLVGATDVNYVYDIRTKLSSYMLYSTAEIKTFNDLMKGGKGRGAGSLSQLSGVVKPMIQRYQAMSQDDQDAVRDYLRKFNHAYSYVTQLVSLHDEELFREYQLTNNLVRLLPKPKDPFIDIDDKIRLEYAKLTESFHGAILLNEKPPVMVPSDSLEPKKKNRKKDTLQNIIDKVNDRFAGAFTDGDRVIIESIYQMFMRSDDVKKFRRYARDNSPEMFVQSLFPDKFKEIVTRCFLENNDSFQKLFNDPDFYEKVKDIMARELYRTLRAETDRDSKTE